MGVNLLQYDDSLIPYVASVYMNKDDATWERVYQIMGRREDSVLEFGHAVFEFHTSLVVRDHLVRYRTASMAAAGLRYNEPQQFVIPPDVRPETREFLEWQYATAMTAYDALRDERVKKEVARYLLPCGVEVRYIMSFNLRTLAKNVFPERLWGRGVQAETRIVARDMYEQVAAENKPLWNVITGIYGLGMVDDA